MDHDVQIKSDGLAWGRWGGTFAWGVIIARLGCLGVAKPPSYHGEGWYSLGLILVGILYSGVSLFGCGVHLGESFLWRLRDRRVSRREVVGVRPEEAFLGMVGWASVVIVLDLKDGRSRVLSELLETLVFHDARRVLRQADRIAA